MIVVSAPHDQNRRACHQLQMLGEPSTSIRLARAVLQWATKGRSTERGARNSECLPAFARCKSTNLFAPR
jgi:hypothetical protein